MGLSMEFYAGDPEAIGHAFTEAEHDGLTDGTTAHAYADFSLHLSPEHLDLLSEQFAAALKRTPVLLTDSLERQVGGDGEESSAEVVSRAWVAMVAAVPPAAVPEIARSWMAAGAAEEGEPAIESSPDVDRALLALIELCRDAERRNSRVVFGWYL